MRLYNGVRLLGSGPCLDNAERIDLGALPMINHMMATGLQIDPSHFQRMHKVLRNDMEDLTDRVQASTGYYCDLASPKEVSELLFKKLGLKQARLKMTKKGDRESTEHEVLVAIQHDHECIPLIMEFKECEKLDGTYVIPIPKLAKRTAHGKRILYPNLGATRVPSSRLNCKEPNLLAIPNRTARGREMAEGFICDSDEVYLSIDLSQIEPRCSAHMSGDKNLLKVYRNNEDIYSDFATKAFKLEDKRFPCGGFQVKRKDYTCDNPEHKEPSWHYPTVHKKDHRFPAKTCILAWFYEVTPAGLLEQMPIICANCMKEATKHDCGRFRSFWTEDMCADLINAANIQYEDALRNRFKIHKTALRHAMVWDLFGRILQVAAVRSVHTWVVSGALREAANFVIQATAQGIMKLIMAQVMDELRTGRMLGKIINPVLQIHDEILFVCKRLHVQEMGAFISDIYEHIITLDVPIKASMARADTWGLMPK